MSSAHDESAPPAEGTWWWLLVLLLFVLGSAAGAVVLAPELRLVPGRGDWRAATVGLRRPGPVAFLSGGRRALVHFHGLDGAPARLALVVSARDAPHPVPLRVERDGELQFALELARAPQRIVVPASPGARSIDVVLSALAPERVRAVYIHEIVLERSRGPAWRLLQALPGALAAITLVALWRRGARTLALSWAVLVLVGVLAALVTLSDPPAALRLRAPARDAWRFGLLAALWGLSLVRPGRAAVAAAVAGTVAALYLPSLRFGFVNEDFNFARPWSWDELAATIQGSWDPGGVVAPYFRPLVTLSLAADHALWGEWTPGYHLTNLMVHMASGIGAYALLARLGLSRRGALAGSVAWLAHPLSASAVAWCNQRTDGLMACFYLGALALLLARPFTRRESLGAPVSALLAFASKEMAITLPVAAPLAAHAGLAADERRRRRNTLVVLCLLGAGYLIAWLVLLGGSLSARGDGLQWEGFERGSRAHWPRLLPGLYAFVFLPTDYETWWRTRLAEWPWAYLAAGLLVPTAALLLLRRHGAAFRVAALGGAWPLLAFVPLLGVREVDLFRLGFMLALGFGLVWGAVVARLEERSTLLSVGLAALLAFALGPRAAASADAWGPGGFVMAQLRVWRQHVGTQWWNALTPEMQRLFLDQVEREVHVWRLLAPAGRGLESGVQEPRDASRRALRRARRGFRQRMS